MTTSFATLVRCLVLTGVVLSTSVAQAAFTSFVIRNGNTPTLVIPNNDYGTPALEFITDETGKKAGLGSNDINGFSIGDITNLSITRHDDTERFPVGSGPRFAPYLNIWVTDGTNYAVIANEPTNGAFQPLFETVGNTKQYNLSFDDLSTHPVQVYETPNGGYGSTNTWVHNAVGINGPLTFADIADLIIGAPDATYIGDGNGIGTGAPREINTNIAYGVNWVFGDSQNNYLSGVEGFVVSSPIAQAVPEPSTVAILGLAGLAGLAIVRRRRQA